MQNRWLFTVVTVAAAAVTIHACGGGGGAGGGNFNTQIGGAVDSPCTPAYHNEGCATSGTKRLRVKCTPDAADATKGTWQLIAECVENKEYCDSSKKDDTDATGAKVLSECKPLGQTGTSSGGTSSGGTSSGGTSSGGTSSGGTSSGGTSSGGTTIITPAEMDTCLKTQCGEEYNACQANSECKSAMECWMKCEAGDSACMNKCGEGTSDEVGKLGAALTICGLGKDCVAMCGDQKCSAKHGETNANCSQDCKENTTGPKCGDGKCEGNENTETCPSDCKTTGPKCGNEVCEDGETPSNCASDCKTTGPKCGNEKCEEGETPSNCASDCKETGPKCGNGKCEEGETPSTCAADCKTTGMPKDCGNLQCMTPETASNCALDCNTQVKNQLICGVEACPSQWNACKNSAKCLEGLNCAALCPDGNSSCQSQCMSGLDSGSQQAVQGFGVCAGEKCSETSPKCTSDAQCASGQKCSDGKCVTDGGGAACTSDGNCQTGEKCVSGKCTKEPPPGTCKDSTCAYVGEATCQCDSACEQYGDCCADKATYCASGSSSGGSSSSSSSGGP